MNLPAMSAALSAERPLPASPPAGRIVAIDLLRGAVMVLMAIDHVRVFSGVPAGGPAPAVFFTRWITHFCAPAFLFLAGTSAFFYGRKHEDLSRFLLVRGAWLVLLELTLIRVSWTFNLDYAHYMLAGVIWVIGWCMILMAVLARLPAPVVGAFGVLVIALHNALMPPLAQALAGAGLGWLAKLLYIGFFADPVTLGRGGPPLFVLYVLVPWIGVMAAGYGFGRVLALERARRDRACLAIGLGATALFLALRGLGLYGDPRTWQAVMQPGDFGPGLPPLLAFLNTTKYPASLQFLLMTLGPAIALVPALERARGRVAEWIAVFGRVPFFFYVLHIPLIHALAIGVSMVRLGSVSPWLFTNHPMANPPPPEGYTWSLGWLYGVWAVAIVLLYFACRWYADLKARRGGWLRFV
jgi:uncharacterized membrane protein